MDHDHNLHCFLEQVREKGLRLNPDKIELRKTSVNFIGHHLTQEGLVVDPNKVEAILSMPTPHDVPSLKRILGMVTYLEKFLPHLSSICAPLRELEKKDVAWHFNEHHQAVWEEVKRLIACAPVLRYYDPEEELTILCDASQNGLGAALLQNGQPVSVASRALTTAEQNYAQIEKENLAIVYSCERFDHYVYGRKVTVETDHKPLEALAKKPIYTVPKRLQRMMLRLQKYDLNIIYKKGSSMYIADTLSRAYLTSPNRMTGKRDEEDFENVRSVEDLDVQKDQISKIKAATAEDEDIKFVMGHIQKWWPKQWEEAPMSAHPYFTVRNELSIQDGLLFKGDRVVVPASLHSDMLRLLHASHIGMEGCIQTCYACFMPPILEWKDAFTELESFYWPGMNAHVRDFVSKCSICLSFKPEQCRKPLQPHEVPERPWSKVGTDLFSCSQRNYLITVDYYSSYFEVDYLKDTLSTTVIEKLAVHFARHGIPDILVSDNGPQFDSDVFRCFTKMWKFQHVTSLPRYPQSNGKVENAVKICKGLMKKAEKSRSDICLALLNFCNTPLEATGTSPVQKIFGRRTRTLLPTPEKLLRPEIPKNTSTLINIAKEKQATVYDRKAKELSLLTSGELVHMKLPGQEEWSPARVQRSNGFRFYLIESGGKLYRCNRRQLRTAPMEIEMCEPESVLPDVSPSKVSQSSGDIETPMLVPFMQDGNQTKISPPPVSATPSKPMQFSSFGRRIKAPARYD